MVLFYFLKKVGNRKLKESYIKKKTS